MGEHAGSVVEHLAATVGAAVICLAFRADIFKSDLETTDLVTEELIILFLAALFLECILECLTNFSRAARARWGADFAVVHELLWHVVDGELGHLLVTVGGA